MSYVAGRKAYLGIVGEDATWNEQGELGIDTHRIASQCRNHDRELSGGNWAHLTHRYASRG